MYLVTANEMQQMDQATISSFGIPGRVLMENAGRGATRFFLKSFGDLARKKIGVMAGRGNNGGDGFVMARCLAHKGHDVTVYLLSESARLKGDAAANFTLLAPLGIPVFELGDAGAFSRCKNSLRQRDIWIDAIFGTGLNSDVSGFFKRVIDFINRSGKPVFSVDIPSGLNADTGRPGGVCIRADATATFAFPKIGHFLYPGAALSGALDVVDIGIPPHIAHRIGPKQHLLNAAGLSAYYRPRAAEAHKGSTGHLLVVAGSEGKTGAAAMAAMAALRSGAGLVSLGIPASLNPLMESRVLEAMTVPLPETAAKCLAASAGDRILELLSAKQCLAIGPGLGTADETRALVCRLISACRTPVVVDADGLNCLAGKTALLKKCHCPVILTPHPGEMARLADTTVARIQANRIETARHVATAYGVHVVLKGARSVIAHPDGNVFVNLSGNPGMASGGMGDVLTGIIAGLITQGYSPLESTHAGTFLHGAAADALARKYGPFGFLASDVMQEIPAQIARWAQADA